MIYSYLQDNGQMYEKNDEKADTRRNNDIARAMQ